MRPDLTPRLLVLPDTTINGDTVAAVIEWLADEHGGQSEFSIGEHWAPYPTDVCDGRIDLAAEILSEAVDAGCGADFEIPGAPVVTREVMDEVRASLRAARDRVRRLKEEREAREAAAEAGRALALRRAEQRARREDQLRRMMDPANNAAPAEREMARRKLEGM